MDAPIFSAYASELTQLVERVVQQRTSGLIRGLKVEMLSNEVVLSGRTATYYAKQLATHAALDVIDRRPLTNDIEVF